MANYTVLHSMGVKRGQNLARPPRWLLAIGLVSVLVGAGCGGSSPGSEASGGRTGTGHGGSGMNGQGAAAGMTGAANAGAGGALGSSGSNVGGNSSGGNAGVPAGSSGAGAGGDSGTPLPLGVCSNGLDDDGDGLIDGFDNECTGPLDDDEGSFATGIPGDNRDPKWQDCFFDGNSGAGDDHCRYSTQCLTGTIDTTDKDCQLAEECVTFCRPLTPNGCDCFGCCTLQDSEGQTLDVLIGDTCSFDKLSDEQACPRCVKSTQCENTCGHCEICPGKTELPADCAPPTGSGGSGSGSGGASGGGAGSGVGGSPNPPSNHTCDGGEQVCTPDVPCDGRSYCQFGCCLPIVR